MNNSYLRNIAKYLDGRNFSETFIKNDRAKLQSLISQLEKKGTITYSTDKDKLLEQLYIFISKNYRNDIVYKIEFLDKIESFIKNTSDSFIVNEFKAGRNLTDLAVFNGKSISFEIKSDLDSAENITKQFNQYEKIFDYSYLITGENNVNELINKLPNSAGIITSNKNFEFSIFREAQMNKNISFEQLFRILRKDEYLDIVKKFYNEVPSVPNTQIFRECFILLSKIDLEKFKIEFLRNIKLRAYCIKISDLFKINKVKRQGYLANSNSLNVR